MSILTLHRAINEANILIRKATKASDDYMHATTEVIFNALWDIVPSIAYSDKLWDVALVEGSGSWIAATRDQQYPHHRYLLLSSCGKSTVIVHDLNFGKFGIVTETVPLQVLPNLGDTLRDIIQNVIRSGDFYGDVCGRAGEIDPAIFKAPIQEGYALKTPSGKELTKTDANIKKN